MRYMRWGWKQLLETPLDVYNEIIQIMQDQAAEDALRDAEF